ncbi:MAG: glycosyltransferase [Rhodospirillales bacterium]
MTPTSPQLLFYVQHLLGVGHVKRASIIARALVDEGFSCHVVLGGPDAGPIDWGGAVCHRLPEVRSPDASFSRYLTGDGMAPDGSFWRDRTTRAERMAAELKPDVLLIEHFPFGRRRFRHEIAALIDGARRVRRNVRVFSSVRDILVSGKPGDKDRKAVDILRRDFDGVLVHGDPAFIPFSKTFSMAQEISDLLTYTGYVTQPPLSSRPGAGRRDHGPVVVAAGGGAVGGNLMMQAMAARRDGLLADKNWVFLIGPNLDKQTAALLRHDPPAGVSIEPNRPDYETLLSEAHVSISQAGYNTIMDLVRTRCPAVVVPLAADGETEQRVRAELLDERGYLVSLDEAQATPDSLSEAVERALSLDIPTGPPFRTDGASQTARALMHNP